MHDVTSSVWASTLAVSSIALAPIEHDGTSGDRDPAVVNESTTTCVRQGNSSNEAVIKKSRRKHHTQLRVSLRSNHSDRSLPLEPDGRSSSAHKMWRLGPLCACVESKSSAIEGRPTLRRRPRYRRRRNSGEQSPSVLAEDLGLINCLNA